MAEPQQIEFAAAVARVQTMADGGLRVVLDLPEDKVFEVAWLMECKRAGVAIQVDARPLLNRENQSDAVGKRDKRKSKWEATQAQDAD